MDISEIQPRCQPGQFWAELNPLTLHRVKWPGDGLITFESWYPTGYTDSCVVEPLPRDKWRFLWDLAYLPSDYFLLGTVYPGDALRDEGGIVWFIGPTDRRDEILIVSDSPKAPPRQATRFQLGVHPVPSNRFETILTDTLE